MSSIRFKESINLVHRMQGKGLLLLGLVAFSCVVDIAIACCKHRGDFYCCGNGPCNVFCCNCDNGCNPSCETDYDGIFNKGVAVAGLVAAGAAVGRRKRSIDHDSYLQDMAYRAFGLNNPGQNKPGHNYSWTK